MNHATPKTKGVAAGKAAAGKTQLAREAQKKAAAEAAIIIANDKAKKAANPLLGGSAPKGDGLADEDTHPEEGRGPQSSPSPNTNGVDENFVAPPDKIFQPQQQKTGIRHMD